MNAPTRSETADAGRVTSGIRRPVVVTVLVLVAVVVLVLDQVSKAWAEANLTPLDQQPLLGPLLHLRLLYNSGAAWGMGSGSTPVVTALQLAIALAVVLYAVLRVRSPWWTIALALVLGGALGNIHDRLLRPPSPFHGEVVDFLELPHWPIFNVADMSVVSGAILIVILGLVGVHTDPTAPADEAKA